MMLTVVKMPIEVMCAVYACDEIYAKKRSESSDEIRKDAECEEMRDDQCKEKTLRKT